MSEQKIFNFQINQSFEYDDFCISKCNELAHNNIINKKNIERLIYLKGPAKSGKTHLGKIWKKINHAYLFSYKNYEKFITKNKNIFIDNLTENLDEEKIFHIINHCYNNNLNLLITSNFFPSEINLKLSDLTSRLKSFYLIQIHEPDDILINNLLLKLLYDRQVKINNKEILSYIINRINRTYSEIYNFVDKIDKLSLSKKRQITIPLIRELI